MLGQLITVDINAWANQVHGCTNSRATVSLPPAHLAVKGTSATSQCCQRPEPLPPLDKREDRGCTPGIGPGERVRRTMPVPELEPTKRNQGRPVRWGTCGKRVGVQCAPACSCCGFERGSHRWLCRLSTLPSCPSPACFKENSFLWLL